MQVDPLHQVVVSIDQRGLLHQLVKGGAEKTERTAFCETSQL
jgi:hypothetical protein